MKQKASPPRKTESVSRVMIVDDHPVVRAGLRALINREPGLTVCGEAEDAREAMDVLKETLPHVVTLDISLKGASGIELLRDMKLLHPKVLVIALSIHDESVYAERLLCAGAQGYIMKQEGTSTVIEGIRAVLKGEIFLSGEMSKNLLRKMVKGGGTLKSPVEQLTNREMEVFRLIGRGYGTGQIGEMLHLSAKTIETYREHIKIKLQVKNARELLQYALQWVRSQAPC